MGKIEDLKSFATLLFNIQKSDRDNTLGVAGETGVGKSTFLTLLAFQYGIVAGNKWTFNNMTWDRAEMLEWIDGEKKSIPLKNGLKPGQLPEYSAIVLDELFLLFYRRTWYDEGQIDSISTLNMCRDRHLLIGGAVPNFWDLDGAFTRRIRFYVYVFERGRAWIFEQDNNPFNVDPWNKNLNKKLFAKYKNPYGLPNYIAEISFPDWTPKQKAEYYSIRNVKRVLALQKSGGEKKEKYKNIKEQRDKVISFLFDYGKGYPGPAPLKLTNKLIGEVAGLSEEVIRLIRNT